MTNIEEIIHYGITCGASDIHLVRGLKPLYRINTVLNQAEQFDVLSNDDVSYIYECFVKNNQILENTFNKQKCLDLNIDFDDNRLRVNISKAMDYYVFTIRIIKKLVPDFDVLNLPNILKKYSVLPQGLILITGKSNSGKSTTLNALVNWINHTENRKIMMLENPVEYVHYSYKSLVVQKEIGIGKDFETFSAGVRNTLREDCDVLVVGEIRDRETMNATIEMAEAGHLVISTMHTRSCAETLDRILSFYDLSEQAAVKYVISSILKVSMTQRLLKGINHELVLAPEIMVVDDVIGALIRKDKISANEIEDAIQSRKIMGNLSLINSLSQLVIENKITLDEAESQLEDRKIELLNRTIKQLSFR